MDREKSRFLQRPASEERMYEEMNRMGDPDWEENHSDEEKIIEDL